MRKKSKFKIAINKNEKVKYVFSQEEELSYLNRYYLGEVRPLLYAADFSIREN